MGVTRDTWDFFSNYVSLETSPNICELGDQQFMCCSPFEEMSWVADYFVSLGYRYVSIDINGKGRAIPIDLDKEIVDPELLRSFDIVTNFGTSEHVGNLYSCFRNIHNLCKVNGLMLHVLPTPGYWPGHGNHYVGIDYFNELSRLCDYTIFELFTRKLSIGGDNSVQTHCVIQKNKDNKFPSEKDFYTLPIFKE